jgi:mannosyltransferase
MTWSGKNAVPDLPAVRPVRQPDIGPHHYKALLGLASLAALRLWILPLRSSLWLDETVTYWSACKGLRAAIARSQFPPGQQFVYTMIAALAMRIGGPSEVVLRLPSLLATVLTAWLLFQLGKALFDRETGILGVLVFTSLHVVAREAAVNARPYGIGLLLVVAAMLQLVRWMRTGRLRNMLAFVVLSAAIPYLHYLFVVVYLVFLIYSFYVRWSGEVRVSWKGLVAARVLILLLILPLLWNAVQARRVSAAASFASTPDASKLFSSFLTPVLGASLLGGLLISVFVCGRCTANLAEGSRSAWVLLAGWLTVPIFILYVVARFTPFETFVPRYFLTAVPALALLIGWMVRSLEPARARIVVATAITVISIVSFRGGLLHPSKSVHEEDWRSAAALVRAAGIAEDTPVLIRVGLIDSVKVRWDLNIDHDSPLLSPISKYPLPGRIVLLPYKLDPDAVNYMQEVYSRVLRPVDAFVLVARNRDGESMIPWLRGWFLGQGFAASAMGHPDGITVLLFRRQSLAASSAGVCCQSGSGDPPKRSVRR